MELNKPDYDSQRFATPAQAQLARDVGCPNPAWIVYWADAGFTDADVMAWFPVTATLSFVPDWAQRLSKAGWAPDEVAQAQAGTGVTMPLNVQRLSVFDGSPEPITFGWGALPSINDPRSGTEGARGALVLVQYLLEVAQHRTGALADMRALLFAYLSEAGVPDVESAKLGGITKQRVSAILKGLRRGKASTQQL